MFVATSAGKREQKTTSIAGETGGSEGSKGTVRSLQMRFCRQSLEMPSVLRGERVKRTHDIDMRCSGVHFLLFSDVGSLSGD